MVEFPLGFLVPGGRPPKPKELHLLHGTWRPRRHGARPAPAKDPSEFDPWEMLRLPGLRNRPLDPLEELLAREGIALPDKPKSP
jgi:hypothetical protein